MVWQIGLGMAGLSWTRYGLFSLVVAVLAGRDEVLFGWLHLVAADPVRTG